METLGTRIRKSGKGLSDQGIRFFAETRTASKELVTFVHDEARDWGDYLLLRYKHLEEQGREMLKQDGERHSMWSHLDGLISRIARKETNEDAPDTQEAAAEPVISEDESPQTEEALDESSASEIE